MPARAWTGANDRVVFASGSYTPTAYTYAIIARVLANGSYLQLMEGSNDIINYRYWVFDREGTGDKILITDDVGGSSQSATTLFQSADSWCMIAVVKGAGTVNPTFYKYKYSDRSWTVETPSDTIGNRGSAVASSAVIHYGKDTFGTSGANVERWISARWERALADFEVRNLPFTKLAWIYSNPMHRVMWDQEAVAQKALDEVKSAAETAITGTALSSSSVPSWSYGHELIYIDDAAAAPAASPKRALLGVGA